MEIRGKNLGSVQNFFDTKKRIILILVYLIPAFIFLFLAIFLKSYLLYWIMTFLIIPFFLLTGISHSMKLLYIRTTRRQILTFVGIILIDMSIPITLIFIGLLLYVRNPFFPSSPLVENFIALIIVAWLCLTGFLEKLSDRYLKTIPT